MIFVTVGTQLPFSRLIGAMEDWAAGHDEPVVAQTGATQGSWPHLEIHPRLPPAEFAALFVRARIIVAHAGIGTILSAKAHRKPLVLLPRKAALGEHRNDHQLATARQVARLPGIHIAWEADEIAGFLGAAELEPAGPELGPTHAELIARLRSFIDF